MPRVSNLDERVRESLRDQIMSGKLEGGAHLSELKISKEFSVSRTPVREALCALYADGLIEMIPHRGAFVREVSPVTAADQKHCYGSFMATAAGMAAQKANIEMLMEVEASISELSTKSGAEFGMQLGEVMSKIRRSAQSGTLDEVLGFVERRMMIGEVFKSSFEFKDSVCESLTHMMGAIKRNKSDVAEKAMREAVQAAFGIK